MSRQLSVVETLSIERDLEQQGYSILFEPGTAIYSNGFSLSGCPELICSVGDEVLINAFGRLCDDYRKQSLPLNEVFKCKYIGIQGYKMRCMVKTLSPEEASWLSEHLTHPIKERLSAPMEFAIVYIADSKNRLPGEPGYDLGDQSVKMIEYNHTAT